MEQRLLEFITCHSEAFQAMFIALFNIDIENFMRELRRNLLSKTRRMKQLEHKKWPLPDGDILANIESAIVYPLF